MMVWNFILRLYCGMVSRWTLSGGTRKTAQKGPGVPLAREVPEEEELKALVSSIKERVGILRETVHQQTREIEEDLETIYDAVPFDRFDDSDIDWSKESSRKMHRELEDIETNLAEITRKDDNLPE